MLRRYTSILCLVSYIAGQLAAVPHAHGGNVSEPSDHGARPHIHISWFGHSHSHDDGDTHHGHQHDVDRSKSISSDSDTSSNDHDSTAVYLPSEVGSLCLACTITGSPDPLDAVQAMPIAMAVATADRFGQLCEANFPGNCSPGTPLYPALRALRI